MGGVSKHHVLAGINKFIINGRKSPANVLGLVITKIPPKIPTTAIIIHIKPPLKKISKTSLNHYNQSISFTTEAMIYLQITTYTGIKTKSENESKERDQQLQNTSPKNLY